MKKKKIFYISIIIVIIIFIVIPNYKYYKNKSNVDDCISVITKINELKKPIIYSKYKNITSKQWQLYNDFTSYYINKPTNFIKGYKEMKDFCIYKYKY